MPTISELLVVNLRDVFGNRNAVSRRAAIEANFSEDVAFTDPDSTVIGWDAVEERAADLLDKAPDSFGFAVEGPEYLGADTGAQAWTFGPAGSPVARGIDVITVVDGRITALNTLLHL